MGPMGDVKEWDWFCLSCNKKLATWLVGEITPDAPITEGMICATAGSVGSQVFNSDEDSDGELIFVICDDCIVSKSDRIIHVVSRVETITNMRMKPFAKLLGDGADEGGDAG